MWTRHRLGYVYALAAFVGLVLVAVMSGFQEWPSRLVIGVAGAALAMAATTNYRVLAQTDAGFVLLDGGRFRQVATRLVRRLPDDVNISVQRDTLITTDWIVGDREYTVPKSSQRAMERIAAATG